MSLCSYGLRLIPNSLDHVNVDSIAVPPELDFNGPRGPGAQIVPAPDVLGAKGTIDIFARPQVPYTLSLIVVYELTSGALGDYLFGLDFFRTAGPTEDVFIDGEGTKLDPEITFGDTVVHVVSKEELLSEVRIARTDVGGRDIELRCQTIPGYRHTAQYSDNLKDWMLLSVALGDGTEQRFVDTGAFDNVQRFYRVVLTPVNPLE